MIALLSHLQIHLFLFYYLAFLDLARKLYTTHLFLYSFNLFCAVSISDRLIF